MPSPARSLRVAAPRPATPSPEFAMEAFVAIAAIAVVLGPIVLVALGGLATLWIGSRYVHPHHSAIHDHEVND
jgi:hypothetical protein